MNMDNVSFTSLFASPLMEIHLDLDLEKLTEFAFEMKNVDKIGKQKSNRGGGWHSDNILEEKHEEFIKLKKEISQCLEKYYSEIFRGMKFKEDVMQNCGNMWVNINEKNHYNEWHIHPHSTLSGVYYIKHDGSIENGNIMFKHPNNLYLTTSHFPPGTIETPNEIVSESANIIPRPNLLLIFPSWLEHKAETNLKDDARISLSFNTTLILEKKS